MTFAETLRSAVEAISDRRLRSALTTLGILIGVAAVMLTVGLGQGAQSSVQAQIDKLGSNLLIVTPGSTTTTTGFRAGRGSASTLTVRDAQMLADHTVAPDVAAVAPVTTTSQSVLAGDQNWTTSVEGTTTAWHTVRARTLQQGRFFSPAESDAAAPVAVVGQTTAAELFGRRSAVGSTITVEGADLTVIGVLASAGASTTADEDDVVLVPSTTFAQRLATSANTSAVSTIYLEATSQGTLSAAYQEAQRALAVSHDVTAATADYTVSSQASLVSTATSTARTLTILLGGIAAISLLVGGIGVMNIMLVSVTERIREIGLRKALGATPGAVRRQFLTEASVLGLAGGLLGLAVGYLGARLLPGAIGQPVTVQPAVAVVALAISVAIGIAAGVYPAARAARHAPIDALRSE
ncbi:ABC transporter permease [Phycicoccus sp. M110.8]|uniref:ABC transporter permease n=1 Tax=Phycicoccus sp. M110.8 TaxID=3075433 RepID=UPI0028FD8D41|nr:ABC transporter permease [Phycicoccus sp. M110.8]MDU0314747.1 ABC transporter permease [Phycicoccus sp. M110.8]